MKRKGFTLVELLAVIVILAVISIITVPMIGNVIEDSRKKALETSVYGIVESANYFALTNTGVHEFVFDETKQGETINGKKLNYSGSIDAEGSLYIDNDGNISLCLENEEYYVYKNYNSGIYIGEMTGNGCVVDYDALTNKYVAMLDDGSGTVSNVYSKEEVNTLLNSYALKTDLENYATKSELEQTNETIETLSTILSSSISENSNNITDLQNSVSNLNDNLANVSTSLDKLKNATFINNSQINISEIECDSGNGVFLVYVSTYAASNNAVNYAGVYLVGVNPIDIIVSYRTILEPSSWASGISFSATEKGFKVTFASSQNYTVSYIKIV